MPLLRVPPPYRGPTRGAAELRLEGGTVRACLEAAESIHPGFLAQVVDEQGAVHRFVKLFRNGELLRRDALGETLSAQDELEIVAAIAGG
jgi:hypothetical protein